MIHGGKSIGLCGETSLASAKQQRRSASISFHTAWQRLSNVFLDQLFVFPTVSPPTVCASDAHEPLFVSDQLPRNYTESQADALRVENSLRLGKDRYLTTLLLKHFPTYSAQFALDAHARAVIPNDWEGCCPSVAIGLTRQSMTWASGGSWTNFAVSAVSLCNSSL